MPQAEAQLASSSTVALGSVGARAAGAGRRAAQTCELLNALRVDIVAVAASPAETG